MMPNYRDGWTVAEPSYMQRCPEGQIWEVNRMNDLIRKQDAINALENTECELSSDEWDELTDAIMQLPTVEQNVVNLGHVAKVNSITMIQNLDWVPVTEKLPELKERVLVYAEDAESWYIAISQIIFPPSPKVYFLGFNGTQKVKAWMPLPTPWKGEE